MALNIPNLFFFSHKFARTFFRIEDVIYNHYKEKIPQNTFFLATKTRIFDRVKIGITSFFNEIVIQKVII